MRYVSLRYFNAAGRHRDARRGPPAGDAPDPDRAPGGAGQRARCALRHGLPHARRHLRPRLRPRLGPGGGAPAGARQHGDRQRRLQPGQRHGFSNREVIEAARRVTGHEIPVVEEPRRPGDPAVLVASNEQGGRELGWQIAVHGPRRDRGQRLALAPAARRLPDTATPTRRSARSTGDASPESPGGPTVLAADQDPVRAAEDDPRPEQRARELAADRDQVRQWTCSRGRCGRDGSPERPHQHDVAGTLSARWTAPVASRRSAIRIDQWPHWRSPHPARASRLITRSPSSRKRNSAANTAMTRARRQRAVPAAQRCDEEQRHRPGQSVLDAPGDDRGARFWRQVAAEELPQRAHREARRSPGSLRRRSGGGRGVFGHR